MKTIKLVMLVCIAGLTYTSCSTDDGNDSGDTAAEGRIVAKIDGTNFESMEIATSANSVSVAGNTVMTIQGGDQTGKTILLIINGFDGEGDYNIDSELTILNTAQYIIPNINNPAETTFYGAPYEDSGMVGNVDVTVFTDTKIEGTFSVTVREPDGGVDTISITEGAFNINL